MMATKKTVIIIGKAGVGKSTIGNKILGHDLFHIGTDYKRNVATEGDLEVFLINTFSPDPEHYPPNVSREVCKKITFGLMGGRHTLNPEEYYMSQIPQIGSLVIFVFKQERFTEDTKAQFEAAIRVLNENASQVSALVITCCEGKTEEAKESIIEDFTKNPLTENIAKFMKRGIHCVGFPDTGKIAKQLLEPYSEGIEHSREILQSLVNTDTEFGDRVELHSGSGLSCNVQ